MKGLLNRYKKIDRSKESGRDEKEDMHVVKRARVEQETLDNKVAVDFLIVGAQKAGTTALVTNLNKHSDVFVKNECQFFTFCWGFGPSWYREQLRTPKRVVGEKTPELIYCDECAPRIKQVCPDAKFIFCIRDPINRLVVLTFFERKDGSLQYTTTPSNLPSLPPTLDFLLYCMACD